MIKIRLSAPNKKQVEFLKSQKKNIGFGGARGGGKSWAVRTKALLLSLNYPGIKILIVRRTYPELYKNHIEVMRREIDKRIVSYNDTNKEFTFRTRSKITFMYCRNDKDLDSLQGSEFDVIFIDEATQLTEHQMKVITACCRGVNDFPKRIYYTCNPGGQGHAYIKRIFIDKNYLPEEDPEDYEFIQSLVTDNEALMKSNPDYVKWLEALPPKLKKAWRYGSWDIFEGQFFEEFTNNPEHYGDHRYTHVIEPLPLESIRRMNIIRGYDFGYSKPFSVGWWGIDSEGVMYRLLELYGCTGEPNEGVKWTPEKQFEEVKRIEREHPYLKNKTIMGVADPSIWDGSRGQSVYETALKNKLHFDKGVNDRVAGWMQMHYRMSFDENGYPMMYVFNTCKHFIRTMPLLTYSETRPEDLDTSLEDHIADETRYVFMSRPIPARAIGKAKPIQDDPLNQRSK